MEQTTESIGHSAHQPEMEQPGTASDHNNSMITAVSADRDHDSPITSPTVHRVASGLNSAGASTEGGEGSGKGRAAADVKFNHIVEAKADELIKLMREIIDTSEVQSGGLQKLIDKQDKSIHEKTFEWKKIVDVSEQVFNDYSKDMESISKEFDEFNKTFLIWQEATYVLDSEKVAKRLGKQEEWMNSMESYLKHTRNELLKSAELIDNAITSLKPQSDNNSNNEKSEVKEKTTN